MKVFLFLIPLTALLSVAIPVFAQTDSSQPPPIQYTVSPEAPGPNASVEIDAQGVGSFLGNATLTWQQDGKTVSSGVNDTTFTFYTGSLGSKTTIHLIINSPDLGMLTNDWVFYPSLVNLVWEANTTVPPFYRGKALYTGGSTVKVSAFPEVAINGRFLATSALSFQWSLNGTLVPQSSGLGENTFTFQGDQLKSQEDVSVEIYTNNTLVGSNDIVIPANQPELVLYELDPLRGEIFDTALPQNIHLLTNEFTVQAQPYFFSDESALDGGLVYEWDLNGSDTTGPDAQEGILTMRQTGSGSGQADLSVSVQNNESDKLVQAADASYQILFGQSNTSNTSLFGL